MPALLCGCSTLPAPSYPPFADYAFTATYVVGDDGRLPFPASDGAVVVRALTLDPAPLGERFGADGARWFTFPAGARVTARGALRAYADGGAPAPALAELLRDAAALHSDAGGDDRRP